MKPEIDNYYKEFFTFFHQYNTEGARELLRSIFHDPANQNPIGRVLDFNSSENEVARKAGNQFDMMVADFHTSVSIEARVNEIMEKLTSNLTDDELGKHSFTPFNALVFSLEDYEYCSAAAISCNFDPITEKLETVFGLNNTVVLDSDSYQEERRMENYDFIHDLVNNEYEIMYNNSLLPGCDLHVHIKMVLFNTIIQDIIVALLEDERFARFPKCFPFYFLIGENATYRYEGEPFLVPAHRPLQLEDLRVNAYFHLYKEASVRKEISEDDTYLFSVTKFARKKDSKFKDLIALLNKKKNKHYREAITTAALQACNASFGHPELVNLTTIQKETLERTRNVPLTRFAELFWKLKSLQDDTANLEAGKFQLMLFDRKPTILPEDNYAAAIDEAQKYSEFLQEAYKIIPPDKKSSFTPAYQSALDRLGSENHPTYKILAMEMKAILREELGIVRETHPLKDPRQEYFQHLIDLIGYLPQTFEDYGSSWSFIFDRLESWEHEAKAAIPATLMLLNKYNEYRYDVRMTAVIGKTLYTIGCQDIPDWVHRAHEENPFYMNFYAEWSTQATAAKWNTCLEAFQRDMVSFNKAITWQSYLYDSKAGFALYCQHISSGNQKDSITAALLLALDDSPADVVTRFALYFADQLKDDATNNKVDFWGAAEKIVALLSRISNLPVEYQKTLENCLVATTFNYYQHKDPLIEDELAFKLSTYPRNPVLLFLKLRVLGERQGTIMAMQKFPEILSTVWQDNPAALTALSAYCLVPDTPYTEIPPAMLYAFYRDCNEIFQAHFYAGGKFVTNWTNFQYDPFTAIVKKNVMEKVLRDHKNHIQASSDMYAVINEIDAMSPEMLVTKLQPGNLLLTLEIIDKLLPYADQFTEELLTVLSWEKEDANLFLITNRYFSYPALQDRMILNSAFQHHLGYFLKHYLVADKTQLVKNIFHKLSASAQNRVIVEVVSDLNDNTVVQCFLPIQKAHAAENKLDLLAERLTTIISASSSRDPEFILLTSNLAVIYDLLGNQGKAIELLEDLFTMDWRRFYKKKEESDDILTSITGKDWIEVQVTAFRRYYAMAHFNAACFYTRQQKLKKSMDHLQQAVELNPDHYTRGKILAEKDFSGLADYAPYKDFVQKVS